jgi:hypothetical protein
LCQGGVSHGKTVKYEMKAERSAVFISFASVFIVLQSGAKVSTQCELVITQKRQRAHMAANVRKIK